MSERGAQGGPGAGPDVTAVLRAGEDAERARRRRAGLAGLAAVALVAGMVPLVREAMRPSLTDLVREERAGWTGSQVIAPVSAGSGEILPSDRFGISADSEPAGAEVWVGERLLGETPLAAEVACRPGEPLAVRFRLRGRPERPLSVDCREQGLLRLVVRW